MIHFLLEHGADPGLAEEQPLLLTAARCCGPVSYTHLFTASANDAFATIRITARDCGEGACEEALSYLIEIFLDKLVVILGAKITKK